MGAVGITSGDFSEGASTITQQLLKLSVFGGGAEDSLLLKFKRKFQEQYLALELEKRMSKEEILEASEVFDIGDGRYLIVEA